MHNIHFRLPHEKVPEWVRRVFIDGIGSRLFISRTVREHRRKEKTKKVSRHSVISRKIPFATTNRTTSFHQRMTALNAMLILEKQFNKTLFHLEMATRVSDYKHSQKYLLSHRYPGEKSRSNYVYYTTTVPEAPIRSEIIEC